MMADEFKILLAKGKERVQYGSSDEELLQFLRQEGASRMQSTKLIKELRGLSLREAQVLLHESETWADDKDSHDELQDVLAQAMLELKQELESK